MIILSVVVTLFFIRPGQAFPRGAPAEACESLLPRHYGTEPKDPEHSPYSFLASSNHYHYRMDGIQEKKLPVRLNNTANERRLVQGHETQLKVKGDIEDVSENWIKGVKSCTSWMKCPEFYCSR
ncbi:uncharacterized protein TNCV_2998331 [Trichonephila clavipes]|nr:uncharacterized protein TNCV_2998331 [Trichonephila clavipes]